MRHDIATADNKVMVKTATV